MAEARPWVEEHRAALAGTPVAGASDEAGRAGLRVRIAGPGEALTLAFVPDRVTLLTDGDGTVTDVQAG